MLHVLLKFWWWHLAGWPGLLTTEMKKQPQEGWWISAERCPGEWIAAIGRQRAWSWINLKLCILPAQTVRHWLSRYTEAIHSFIPPVLAEQLLCVGSVLGLGPQRIRPRSAPLELPAGQGNKCFFEHSGPRSGSPERECVNPGRGELDGRRWERVPFLQIPCPKWTWDSKRCTQLYFPSRIIHSRQNMEAA